MFQKMSHGSNDTATGLLLELNNSILSLLVLSFKNAFVAIQDLKSAYQAMCSEDELNKLISNSRLFANKTQSTLPDSELHPKSDVIACLPASVMVKLL